MRKCEPSESEMKLTRVSVSPAAEAAVGQRGPVLMSATLIRRGWLLRGVEVSTSDGVHFVEYNGRGIGYEQVLVDGVVIRKRSWYWFVPRFEFKLGGRSGVVEVRVWAWLSLRSLVLRVGDRIAYAEGAGRWNEKQSELPSDWDELA